jgi:hypothetical protein
MLLMSAREMSWGGTVKGLSSLAVILLICGCGMSRQEHLVEARTALADAAYADAITAAEAGLQMAAAGDPDSIDDPTAWGLELIKLEAYARDGQGDAAKQQLTALASLHPERVAASEYFATAHQLRGAGAGTAAIEVLDMGAILFPYEPVIARMIEESGESGDPAELELLRSLGYVE